MACYVLGWETDVCRYPATDLSSPESRGLLQTPSLGFLAGEHAYLLPNSLGKIPVKHIFSCSFHRKECLKKVTGMVTHWNMYSHSFFTRYQYGEMTKMLHTWNIKMAITDITTTPWAPLYKTPLPILLQRTASLDDVQPILWHANNYSANYQYIAKKRSHSIMIGRREETEAGIIFKEI